MKTSLQSVWVMICSISAGVVPAANEPPTTEPMLVPVTQSTGTRSSSRTFSTPMCAAPRAPPPESARPIFGRVAPGAGLGAPCAKAMLDARASETATATMRKVARWVEASDLSLIRLAAKSGFLGNAESTNLL